MHHPLRRRYGWENSAVLIVRIQLYAIIDHCDLLGPMWRKFWIYAPSPICTVADKHLWRTTTNRTNCGRCPATQYQELRKVLQTTLLWNTNRMESWPKPSLHYSMIQMCRQIGAFRDLVKEVELRDSECMEYGCQSFSLMELLRDLWTSHPRAGYQPSYATNSVLWIPLAQITWRQKTRWPSHY